MESLDFGSTTAAHHCLDPSWANLNTRKPGHAFDGSHQLQGHRSLLWDTAHLLASDGPHPNSKGGLTGIVVRLVWERTVASTGFVDAGTSAASTREGCFSIYRQSLNHSDHRSSTPQDARGCQRLKRRNQSFGQARHNESPPGNHCKKYRWK